MNIKILFDSTSMNSQLVTGWGFSCLINDRILFDTGENENYLLSNMKKMNISTAAIKLVVISHDHWDHTRGMWGFLKKRNNVTVYACPSFDKSFHKNVEMRNAGVIKNKSFCKISKNIYTTGEIIGNYKGCHMPEQALVLKTPKGIVIITGCAHPGIVKIIKKVQENIFGDIYLVLGGFHLKDKHPRTIQSIVAKFRELGIKKVAPCHCTGEHAIELFKQEYVDDFIEIKVGQKIKI